MMREAILAPMLALAILLLTPSLHLTTIGDDVGSENYLVILNNGVAGTIANLVVVNSAGAMAIIYQLPLPSFPGGVTIDSSGNYIITESYTESIIGKISKVTPEGERTVIYTYPTGYGPNYGVIDSSGNYIVAGDSELLKITPTGERTTICNFPANDNTMDVAIDSSGNYIVCEFDANVLSKITPAGERTVICTFPEHSGPNGVVIDSSGNYIINLWSGILEKVTPAGEITEIYRFNHYPESALCKVAIDSSGNYIVCEYEDRVLSKVTPTGDRTVICTFPENLGSPDCVLISTAPELFFTDVTDNGLTATWTQSAGLSFAGYQLYQSTTQGELGTLIGTNTNVADTSLSVTGLSPWTTYYFTLRALGANGAYVDYGPRSVTTAKAFWQQTWFQGVMVVVVMVVVVAIAIYVVHSRSKKKAKIT